MQVEIPVSIGELVDKITILEIKHSLITQASKLVNIDRELKLLKQRLQALNLDSLLDAEQTELHTVNRRLWDIENFKRNCERCQKFDSEFVEAARMVYIFNDQRAEIKRRINDLVGSEIREEKSY